MRLKALALTAFVLAIGTALLGAAPNGDVKINQGNWARMLADRMGIPAQTDAEAIAYLGGRGGTIEVSGQSARLVSADGAQRSWRWDVTIPKTAIWLVSVQNKAGAFVTVDKRPSVLVAAAPNGGRSDAGRYPLAAGPHSITVANGQNATAPDLRLAGGCSVVEPPGGWTSAPLTYGTLARTLVTAMRQTSRLPAAEALTTVSVRSQRASINVPGDGAYTVLLSRPINGVSYRLDECDDTRLLAAVAADGWREGATMHLTAGEHPISIAGMDPSRSELKVRLVRRSTSDADYLGVLQAMGVKLQPVAMLERGDSTLALAPAEIVGGPRHAQGDATLGSLASKTVTRAEAERILGHPAIARYLANASRAALRPPTERRKADGDPLAPLEDPLTYPEPVSPTLPGGQLPDPL